MGVRNYTVSQKTCNLTFAKIFVKHCPIFKILLLAHRVENLQYRDY